MFTPEQIKALEAKLDPRHVATRSQSGRQLSYIEGWWAIAEANRIFGFDGWTSEIIEMRCVTETPRKVGQSGADGFGVSYVGRVRITIDGVVREAVGAGHGIDRDLGLAHESAIKECETDSRKRCLMTFGNPFGLALYDKTQANVGVDAPAQTVASDGAQNAIRRLTSARAKEIGLHDKIKDQIEACATLGDLHEWDAGFDKHTAECPQSWLDAIRNQVILRGEEIMAEGLSGEMDDAFRETMREDA